MAALLRWPEMKCEFQLADAHFISGHRSSAAIRYGRLRQDASGHRALDMDVLLAGLAGGRDFPAEQFSARIILDRRLNGVALGAIAWSQRSVERVELGPGAPMIVQDPGCRGDLVLVEHGLISE